MIQVERADRLAESLLALAKADQAGLDLDLQLDDAQLTVDQGLLTLLLANLMRNAIIQNGPDVTVAVAATNEDGRAVLRLSTERHGHGHGLAIVEAVARSHNAEVNIASRPAGGLDVVVGLAPLDRS